MNHNAIHILNNFLGNLLGGIGKKKKRRGEIIFNDPTSPLAHTTQHSFGFPSQSHMTNGNASTKVSTSISGAAAYHNNNTLSVRPTPSAPERSYF